MELTGHSLMKLKICNCITVQSSFQCGILLLQFFPPWNQTYPLAHAHSALMFVVLCQHSLTKIGAGEMDRPDNASNDSCLQFTKDRFKQLLILRIYLTSVVCLVCCVACLMIFITKAYQRFVHRLILYLILSAFCESLVSAWNGSNSSYNQ